MKNQKKVEGSDRCPVCTGGYVDVIDSRASPVGRRRRRRCQTCEHAWTTYEVGSPVGDALHGLSWTVKQMKELIQRSENLLIAAQKSIGLEDEAD